MTIKLDTYVQAFLRQQQLKSSPKGFETMASKLQDMSGVNREVGVDKRFARNSNPVDPRVQQLIDQTLKNGYVIIPNAFSNSTIEKAKAELVRLSASSAAGPASQHGRNPFEGYNTRRVYALLDKSRVFDEFVLHPDVLALNEYFLDPGFLLNALHSINIQPGEKSQTLHHDDGYVTIPRPHKPFGTAVMIALDAYTESNGATVVVPESHEWGNSEKPDRSQAIPVIMPQGSLVYFLGTLWHGGGQNMSSSERNALTVQYCQPWMRPLENQMLAVKWDKLNEIPPRLVDMLGYKVGAPFVGYVDGVSPRRAVEALLKGYGARTSSAQKL